MIRISLTEKERNDLLDAIRANPARAGSLEPMNLLQDQFDVAMGALLSIAEDGHKHGEPETIARYALECIEKLGRDETTAVLPDGK